MGALLDYPIIDTHFHPYTKVEWKCMKKLRQQLELYLYHHYPTEEEVADKAPTDEEMAENYRKLGVVGMPVGWDAETAWNDPPTNNDYVASLVKRFPDVFITGWACVDPWKGELALREAERSIRELNLIGIKFQQAAQAFNVADRRFYPLWDLCQELGAPIQLHGGYTGLGSGAGGAMGVRLSYMMPMDVDTIAADFPNLKIFVLHVGDPWLAEFSEIAWHKKNIYRECSGMWPRYFPKEKVHEMNGRLQDKYVFGTDYPLFPIEGLVEEHVNWNYKPGVLEKIMYKNTINILGDELERVGVDLRRFNV
jgi:hypothetical protein